MHFIFMIAYKYGMGRPGINIEAKSLEIIRESFLSLEDISFNFSVCIIQYIKCWKQQ